MPHTPSFTEMNGSTPQLQGEVLVPVNPFHALRYQYGMLLGAEDFEAAQAYARGKIRLHNAWLHGEGVVWGLGVTSDVDKGEIRVAPGLALDALGHELCLDSDACVNVPAWYAAHKDDEGLESRDDDGIISFTVRVEARFNACLTRQVPAMSQPCEGGAKGVAFSRAVETMELRLVAGAEPEQTDPYHLLRMLFGLEGAIDPKAPSDDEKAVATALAAVASKPMKEQAAAFLAQFRTFAALDTIALHPGKSSDPTPRTLLFPAGHDAPVLLATVNVELVASKNGELTLNDARIEYTGRKAHVSTRTIQELNLLALDALTSKPPLDDSPRIDRTKLIIEGKSIVLPFTQPLHPHSVHKHVFHISELGDEGWTEVRVQDVNYDRPASTVTLELQTALKPDGRYRLVARGIGPKTLLGADGRPFGGATDDPRRPTEHDGIDFVHMWKD